MQITVCMYVAGCIQTAGQGWIEGCRLKWIEVQIECRLKTACRLEENFRMIADCRLQMSCILQYRLQDAGRTQIAGLTDGKMFICL